MGKSFVLLGILAMVGQLSFAEELVPATSDDINSFDQQVSNSKLPQDPDKAKGGLNVSGDHKNGLNDPKHTKKDRHANFGLIVSTEAKKLKDEPADQRKEMGKWVSDQRKKNDQNSATGAEDQGGASASNDAKSSAPANNNRGGGSSSTPGQSGNHHR